MARSLRVVSKYIDEVKLARQRNGFPRDIDLAEELGLSRDTVSKFLNGKPVDHLNFRELCGKLALDWQQIAGLGRQDTTGSQSFLDETEPKPGEIEQQRQAEQPIASLDNGTLYNALLRLNFTNQVSLFRHFVETHRVGSCLIHGEPEYGHRLLIDEIDKADIDFPNDLLLELDEQRFVVEETGEEIPAKAAPIVIITSNDEKDLPDAFLRRCLFHYVEFPKRDRLIEIVKAFFPTSPEQLVDAIIDRFLQLREEMRKDKGDAGKKVSTSELMDWFRVLSHYPQDEVLKKLEKELLYPGVLLKSWDDYRVYSARMQSEDKL